MMAPSLRPDQTAICGSRRAARCTSPGCSVVTRGSPSGRPTPHRPRPEIEPWISELLPDPATPVTTTKMPRGISTSTSRRLCVPGPAYLQHAGRRAQRRLQGGSVVEMAARDRAARPQRLDGPFESRPRRRPSRRLAPGPPRGPRSRWSPACARRPAPCCPCRAAAAAARSSAGCRADGGRSWAHRRHR